jgi:hypothetical protein
MYQHTIIGSGEGESNVVAFIPGDPMPLAAHSSHPNYERIVALLKGDEDPIDAEDFRGLFDVGRAVQAKFRDLSERVTVQSGHVFFDGDEIDSSLTRTILRFMDEGVEDWRPLVHFFENVQQNPLAHSREQLYDWLNAREGVTITPDGQIVAYKGVGRDGDKLLSIHSGRAIVNGQPVKGRIPNAVGDVITMPRSEVVHDPATACSQGLHVGTYEYAGGWAQGAMLKVIVNPRDVVSVPGHAGGEKIRVCRYKVAEVIDAPITSVIDTSVCDEDDDNEWGDGEAW